MPERLLLNFDFSTTPRGMKLHIKLLTSLLQIGLFSVFYLKDNLTTLTFIKSQIFYFHITFLKNFVLFRTFISLVNTLWADPKLVSFDEYLLCD